MRVTQWGEYATHFCIYLAQQEKKGARIVPAADIARDHQIDPLYAQQILQRLRKNNIIQSTRGAHGGYMLSRPSEEISLQEILVAAEGDTFEVICEARPIYEQCGLHDQPCNLRNVWTDLKAHINEFLQSRKLSELVMQQEANLLVSISPRATQTQAN